MPMSIPQPRRYSKIEVPLHFVWATYERRALITPEMETVVYRTIQSQAQNMQCAVMALNGMPDHIHLVVLFTPNIAIKDFVRRIKNAVWATVRERYGEERFFRWSNGYAVIGFRLNQMPKVVQYVQNQKEHHANHRTVEGWEETEVWRDDVLYRAGDLESGWEKSDPRHQ
jgi:REP element-mobilizing transposase RayT